MTGLRECVADGERWSLLDGSSDEAGSGEGAQARGEHGVADAVARTRELTETGRPAAEVAQYDAGPALAEQVEGTRERRVAARASLGVLTRAELRAGNEQIEAAAAEAGREPRSIRRIINVQGLIGDGPAPPRSP